MNDYIGVKYPQSTRHTYDPLWSSVYFAERLIHCILLGSAQAPLATSIRPSHLFSDPSNVSSLKLPAEFQLGIYEYFEKDMACRMKYEEIMADVFIKALWSGLAFEEAPRSVSGLMMLSFGHALSTTASPLRGRGAYWLWREGRLADADYP